MSSKKRSSMEQSSQKSSENRQSRNNKSTRSTSYNTTVDDEAFIKIISKEMETIENEREKKIKVLIERMEDFKRDHPRYSQDTRSQQLASKADQLLDQLHTKLGRPPLYQHGMQMESDSNACERRGGGTKTTAGFGDGKMMPRRTGTNSGNSSLENIVQGAMGRERVNRADQLYDNRTKTPVGSGNDRILSGHTPTESAHRSMEAFGQDTMRREKHSGVDNLFDECTKTPVDSANEWTILDYTHTEREQLPMEVTEQDDTMISKHRLADACSDSKAKITTRSKNIMKAGQAPPNNERLLMEFTEQNALEADGSRRLCLLLLGSAGNGKSSIGNSILGNNEFKTSSSVFSPAPSIAMGSAKVGDQIVQVVDGPSIFDSSRGNEQDFMEQVVIAMEKSLTLCDYAFSAIVIVLRFGVRFTKQEVDTIKLIKSVLGKDVIKDYGICAVSGGDNFDIAVEEAREDGQELTFEGWCREQTGEVRALFEECNFRCVLFDNRTKDVNKKSAQRLALLKMVNPAMRYSKKEFLKAEDILRELLATEALVPDLEQQTQQLIEDTRSDMQDISEDDSLQYNTRMESLLKRLADHEVTLNELGLSSQNLNQLFLSLKVLKNEICSKISHRSQMGLNRRPLMPPSRSHLSPSPPQPAHMSSNPWYTEQLDSNIVPTAKGHRQGRENISFDWIKQNIKRILLRLFLNR